MTMQGAVRWCLTAAMVGVLVAPQAQAARDAAFLDPGAGGAGANEEAIKVEPKGEIDMGDTIVNSAKRTTLFFVNNSGAPVTVEKITTNGDANVISEITSDDCTKQKIIAPQSRCSVEVSVTPSSGGSWSVETLMTHNGAGRIARARISGKTSGSSSADKKETGLGNAAKEPNPVNFGDVLIGSKVAHSAIMTNDSAEPITLYSIDVIEANNSLTVLDQGCAVDMELKPSETCPITLVWEPTREGQLATDIIIRHSGRQGFSVVPVRGKTKDKGHGGDDDKGDDAKNADGKGIPKPPSAADLDKVTAHAILPVPDTSLGPKPLLSASLRLIGTVGNRAVLLLGDGSTKIVSVGDDLDVDGQTAKVLALSGRSVDISVDGKKKTYTLGAAPELIAKAAAQARAEEKKDSKKSGSSNSSSSSTDATKSSSGSSTSLPVNSSVKGSM